MCHRVIRFSNRLYVKMSLYILVLFQGLAIVLQQISSSFLFYGIEHPVLNLSLCINLWICWCWYTAYSDIHISIVYCFDQFPWRLGCFSSSLLRFSTFLWMIWFVTVTQHSISLFINLREHICSCSAPFNHNLCVYAYHAYKIAIFFASQYVLYFYFVSPWQPWQYRREKRANNLVRARASK